MKILLKIKGIRPQSPAAAGDSKSEFTQPQQSCEVFQSPVFWLHSDDMPTGASSSLAKIEKILFYFLAAGFFWQLRFIWQPLGRGFNEWTSIYLYATDLIVAAVLFLWLVRIWRGKLKFTFSRADIFLGIFLAVAGLSIAVATDKLLAGYGFIKLLEMAALFLYVKNNFSKICDLRIFWHLFIGSALIQSGAAITQFFIQKNLGLKFFAESPLSPGLAGVAKIVVNGQNFIRAYGLVPHPNILVAILIVALFGLAYLWIKHYQNISLCHKIMNVVVLAVLLWALFLTFSRALTIVGLALLILWLVYLWRQKVFRRPIAAFVCLLFIVYCLLFIVYWPYVSSRYDPSSLAGSQSVNLRVLYNGAAWNMIKQSPSWGVGQGNFVLIFGQSYDKLQSWVWQPVHNVYLLIAAETGISGLLAFLAFLFLTIKSAWLQRKNLLVSCLLSLVSFLLIIGLFDHLTWDLQQGQIMFWLALGLLASSPRSSMDRT